jgi:tetratricopeptide (TPR) repeat protein
MMGFGNAAWEQDDFAAAFQHFRATLQDHPNFADIRNRAGLCLAMMGDPEGALEQFDKALEVNDCYAEALMNRAIVLNDLNRHDEAAECFHRASALDLRDSRGESELRRCPRALGSTPQPVGRHEASEEGMGVLCRT